MEIRKPAIAASLSFLLLLPFFCFHVTGQDVIDGQQREIVFKRVNVIPMDSDRVLREQDVVVKAGKIISIRKNARYSKSAFVIDAKDKYLIPGLAEMHAHVPPVDDLEPMKEVLLLFACNGVTTIRGMLGHPRHLELRKLLADGVITGPRFYTSGRSFNGSSVASPEAGAAMVTAQKKAGYDFLKFHPGLTLEKFNGIVAAANREKIPFAGHVSYAVGIWRAIDARYATIDHMDGFIEGLVPQIENISEQDAGLFGMYLAKLADTSRIKKLTTGLREKNISVIPTQALAERWMFPTAVETFSNAPEMMYINNATLNNWKQQKATMMNNPKYNAEEILSYIQLRRKLLFACQKNGVRLLLGSDAPQIFNVPGFSLHQELGYLVNAGLTPYEALQTGTVNVAAFFNKGDAIGKVQVGMASDLVLLNGNPLTDIAQSKNIAGVMLGSKWLSEAYIKSTLKKLEKR